MIANPLYAYNQQPSAMRYPSFLESHFGRTALKIAAVCLALVIAAAIVAIPPLGVPLSTIALVSLSSSLGGAAAVFGLFGTIHLKKRYNRLLQREIEHDQHRVDHGLPSSDIRLVVVTPRMVPATNKPKMD